MTPEKLYPLVTVKSLAPLKEFYCKHFACTVPIETHSYLHLVAPGGVELAFMTQETEARPRRLRGRGLPLSWRKSPWKISSASPAGRHQDRAGLARPMLEQRRQGTGAARTAGSRRPAPSFLVAEPRVVGPAVRIQLRHHMEAELVHATVRVDEALPRPLLVLLLGLVLHREERRRQLPPGRQQLGDLLREADLLRRNLGVAPHARQGVRREVVLQDERRPLGTPTGFLRRGASRRTKLPVAIGVVHGCR